MSIKRLLITLLSTVWCLNLSYAATNADYAMLPERQKVSISPDGSKVVYQYNKNDKRTAIVYDIDNKKLIKGFDLEKLNARRVYFLTDTYVIIEVSELMTTAAGESNYSTAYVYDIAEGELRRTLTLGLGIYKYQSGVGDIVGLSKDGKYAFMPAYTASGDYDVEFSVMKVNLQREAKPRAIYSGDESTRKYFVNDEGKPIAQTIMDTTKGVFKIRGLGDKNRLETIFEKKAKRPVYGIRGTSPDFKGIYVSQMNTKDENTKLSYLSLATGEFSSPEFELESKDISRIYTNSNHVVQGVRYSGFSPSYHFLDKGLNQRVNDILAMFKGHSVRIADISDDLKNIVVAVEGPEFAGDYYAFREGKSPVFIGGQRPAIKPADIQPQVTWSFEASDGLTIPVLLTIPKGSAANVKSLPTVVLPHGGPASHDRLGFDWLSQILAKQGYLVLQPQFRGSTGFGSKHYFAGFGEWGQKMQSDITETVEKLVAAEYVDPSRVCIMGWSYGGYAALAGGAFTPDLYQCVVSINGVSDLASMLTQERRDHSRWSTVVAYWERQMGGKEKPTNSFLDSISPAQHADKFTAPVMLIHGKDDRVVRQSQSDLMESKLKKLDKPVVYHKFKGDGHSLKQVGTRIEMMNYILPFLSKHLDTKK